MFSDFVYTSGECWHCWQRCLSIQVVGVDYFCIVRKAIKLFVAMDLIDFNAPDVLTISHEPVSSNGVDSSTDEPVLKYSDEISGNDMTKFLVS
jgi:hypothetical protein